MKKKWFLPLGILAVFVLAAMIYTRPMPLEALCEADITQCQSVFGYHFRAPQVEDTRFEFPSNDTRCAQLTALFAQQKFRRSLANLLPQGVEVDLEVHEILPVEPNVTGVGLLQQIDAAQERGLAGAGRADDAYDLAAVDL